MQAGPTRPGQEITDYAWEQVEPGELEPGDVSTVIAGGRAIAITRTEGGYGALDPPG